MKVDKQALLLFHYLQTSSTKQACEYQRGLFSQENEINLSLVNNSIMSLFLTKWRSIFLCKQRMILIFILNQNPARNEIVRTHIVDHFQESDNTQKRPSQGLANLHKQDPFEQKDSAVVLRYILGKASKRSPHLVLCTICIILEVSLNGRASSKVAVS